MASPEVMPSTTRYIHLPTEVLSIIAKFIFNRYRVSPDYQSRLYTFCLVSRQWYSAGIGFLYRRPGLYEGNRFSLFTRTVCPSVRSRERRVDLGSLVQKLDLSQLVHHSSNSLTARLLGRVKQKLRIFVAPRVSFAINSLAPLSKCRELLYLDLALVNDTIAFSALKKAISGLNKLWGLKLPSSMCITDDGSGEDWPISLQYLQVGGRPDIQKMPSFRWPQNIRRLDLCGLSLTAEVLENILINEQLHATITRLCIHSSNRVAELWDSAILGELFMLDALEIPVDLFYRLLLHPAFDTSVLPIPIRQLDLLAPCDMEFAMIMGTEIVPEGICGALELTLSLVCSLGISRDCLGIIPKSKHAEIDKLVWKNIDRCPEIELETIFELGVYVINPPAC